MIIAKLVSSDILVHLVHVTWNGIRLTYSISDDLKLLQYSQKSLVFHFVHIHCIYTIADSSL